MLTFKDYLVEAQFTEDDFARVLSVFERRLPKLLGTRLYRYGGAGHEQKFSGFNSILYFFGNSAFAVRHKNGHILGIDVWEQYSINNAADFFIDVTQLSANSLIGSITKLAELIKSPKAGEFEVPNLTEGFNLQEMAKRVDGKTFYDLMVNAYGKEKVKRVNWAEIKKVADDTDVLIPGYVRGQKAARGFWNVTASADEDESGHAGFVDEPNSGLPKKDHILVITVTAQDADTKKFVSAAESASAQKLYTQIASSLNQKPSDKELRDPETLYGHLSQLVDMVCKGTLKSLLIYGGPGTGKCLSGSVNIEVLTKEDLYDIEEEKRSIS
jgi:hypothetical protein